ncbi:hypothetical protein AMTRI_Chr01g113840 [Amborella trichopoda]
MNSSGMMNGLSIELRNQSNYMIWRSYAHTSKNIDAIKKWRVTNAKANSILNKSISHNLFDHIVNCKSACDIWIALDGVFNKKGINNLCLEISLLDPEEPISEARMNIRNLKREYIPYAISIQGWAR